MSDYTKGPWRYQREDNFEPSFGWDVLFEVYTDAGLYGNPATCKKEADARLIAAAPELLEALREAERHLEVDNALHPDLHPVGECPVLDLIRTAIAKAEGRQEEA